MPLSLEQLPDGELEEIYRDLCLDEGLRKRALEVLQLRGHFRDRESLLGHLSAAAS